MNYTRIAFIALALLLPPVASCSVFAQSAPPASAPPEIIVTGTGQVTVKPDTAYISLGVVTRGKEAAAISQQNAAKTTAVIKAVRAMGIAEDDIRTEDFRLNTDYAYTNNKTTLKGYVVSNAVRVVVRDIAKAGTVLGAALRAGANTAGGVTFGIADSQKARDAALTKAIADATRQAQVVAKAANISFITLQQLRVGGEYEPEAQYYGAADAQMASASRAGTPLRAGQLTIAASVTARFVARERAPVLTP